MDEAKIERRLTSVEEQVKFNTHEIEELKPVVKEIHKMSETMVKLTEQSKQTNENVNELKAKVDRIEAEPAENFRAIKKTVITAIITGVISAILGAVLALVIK